MLAHLRCDGWRAGADGRLAEGAGVGVGVGVGVGAGLGLGLGLGLGVCLQRFRRT